MVRQSQGIVQDKMIGKFPFMCCVRATLTLSSHCHRFCTSRGHKTGKSGVYFPYNDLNLTARTRDTILNTYNNHRDIFDRLKAAANDKKARDAILRSTIEQRVGMKALPPLMGMHGLNIVEATPTDSLHTFHLGKVNLDATRGTHPQHDALHCQQE